MVRMKKPVGFDREFKPPKTSTQTLPFDVKDIHIKENGEVVITIKPFSPPPKRWLWE